MEGNNLTKGGNLDLNETQNIIIINSDKDKDKEIQINLLNNSIPNANVPMSKKQLKKIKKKEYWDTQKKVIRKTKKNEKKERKLKAQEIAKTLIPEDSAPVETPRVIAVSRKIKEQEYLDKSKNGIITIIDCGFEDLMNDKDIFSLARQITLCYSVNKKSEKPFNYILYDVGDRIIDQLKKNNYQNWTGMSVIRQGEFKSLDDFIINFTNGEKVKEDIVYLTADSENEVNELNEKQVYIIGGIVDRNRFKMITYNKSKELGINHGKLPIGEYVQLNSSLVMTTNHVFSILSYFNNVTKDWKDAFMSIIPKRKIDD